MSYIRCFDNYSSPYYRPSENLRGLFKNLVVQPFEDQLRTSSWINLVKNTNFKYHREEILDQGRTNFGEWHGGFSPKEISIESLLQVIKEAKQPTQIR